jgi:hypothetical protein
MNPASSTYNGINLVVIRARGQSAVRNWLMKHTPALRALVAIAWLTACLAVVTPTGVAAIRSLPPTRTYLGRIVAGTGAYAKIAARMTVALALVKKKSLLPLYAVMITFRGAKCHTQAHRARKCLMLTGTLHGEAEEATSRVPVSDQPERIRISSSSGSITGLGAVTATGSFEGTGFVPKGARSLRLEILTKRGTVRMAANGPLVPGFTPA